MHKLIDPADIDEPGTVVRHPDPNRKARRAEAAVKARSLPKSIWKITKVYSSAACGMVNHLIYVERRDRTDHFSVWSKESEGVAPVVGGLLERMSRPEGGEAMIWTDATASKASIGGGYTKEAVPVAWEPQVVLARVANIAKVNEQYRATQAGLVTRDEAIKSVFDGPAFRQATAEELAITVSAHGIEWTVDLTPMKIEDFARELKAGVVDVDVVDGNLVIKRDH